MQYFRPGSIDEALKRLAQFEDARPIAGGATLMAMLNAELLEPTALVSLAAISELVGIESAVQGITIRAMTRHHSVAASDHLTGDMAVVRLAAAEIGHPAIRAVGTIGGSIAHADPAADYPTALTAANAQIEVTGFKGSRNIPVHDFFQDYFTTAIENGEIVTAVRLPKPHQNGASAYQKIARSDGDFAIASLAVSGVFDNGRCVRARVAVGGCAAVPVHVPAVDDLLNDAAPGDPQLTRAADELAAACDPIDDVRGSADYRRLLVRRLLPEAFAAAARQSLTAPT